MILLSHPTANGLTHHVARALERAGVLGELWTCDEPSHCLPGSPVDSLEAAAGLQTPVDSNLSPLCDLLDREVSERLASELFKGVYAFEDAAKESFRAAGGHGLLRFYDLPAGHWRAQQKIFEEEAEREPEWAETADFHPLDTREAARKNSELEQADLIFVSSTFLLRTLERAIAPKATVAALQPGATIRNISNPREWASHQKLRALFVGPLAQRKGLSYLFRACRELRAEVSLTVIGPPPPISCPALERELRDVQWLSIRTPEEIRHEMAAHDVLIAPSLFEGFDPVLPEALASGMPVIATPNTAAPDLIDDSIEGFIVPIRSPQEIVARLELLRREPDRLAHMSARAQQRARNYTWDHFERALAASVTTALAQR